MKLTTLYRSDFKREDVFEGICYDFGIADEKLSDCDAVEFWAKGDQVLNENGEKIEPEERLSDGFIE